jgi:hypothetical protein
MSDREYFRKRAEVERAAAIAAKDRASCRIHMTMAREYDWRANAEPKAEVVARYSA